MCSATLGWLWRQWAASSEEAAAERYLPLGGVPRRPSESSLRLVWPTIPRRLQAVGGPGIFAKMLPENAGRRRPETSWSSETTSSAEAPPLQRPEQLVVGGRSVSAAAFHPDDLPVAVVPDAQDDQYTLVLPAHPHPHLLVAGVNEEVRISPRLQPALPPRFELRSRPPAG